MLSCFLSQDAEAKEVEIEDDEPYDIFLWLYDNPDEIMKTEQEAPDGDQTAVSQKTWFYGTTGGGDDLPGGFELFSSLGGDIKGVRLFLTIENPNFVGSVHVDFFLRDDSEAIAEGGADIGARGSRNSWDLQFTGPATGQESYLFEEGSSITLYMEVASGDQVNIVYDDGNDNYYLMFRGRQFYDTDEEEYIYEMNFYRIYEGGEPEEIRAESSDNNENSFHPNEVAENALVYINGSIKNSLGNYDVREIEVEIKDPDGVGMPDPGTGIATLTPVDDGDRYWVEYSYAWDYSGVAGLDDGEYTANLTFKDNMDRDSHPSDYKYGESIFRMSNYGTYLSLTEGEVDEKRVSAGEYVEFEIRVYNTGLEEDTFVFEYTEYPGWEVSLKQGETEVDEVTVEAEDTDREPIYTTVTLNISVPEDAPDEGKSFEVKSSSTGSGDTKRILHKLPVRVDVSPKTGVEVYFLDGEKHVYEWVGTAEKGEEKDFPFSISNGGTAEDSFLLQWDDKPADWDFWFVDPDTEEVIEDKTVTIQASTDMEIWFRVRPAEDINSVDEADVTLTARSESDNEVEASVDILVYRTLGVVVETEQNKEVEPNKVSTMTVWVENTGDETQTFDLSYILPTDMTGWILSFEEDSLSVDDGDKEQTTLSIKPPAGVEARDEGYTFTIRAEGQEDDNIYFELHARVYIKAGYSFSVEPTTAKKDIDAGEKAEYAITVQNTGNVKITVNLRIDTEASDIKDGWKATLDFYYKELEPSETASFILTVEAPDDAKNEEKTKVVVSVTIQQDPDVEAQTVTTETKAEQGLLTAIFESDFTRFAIIALAVAVGIVVILGVMSRREEYEDEEEEYEEGEEYEDAEEYV